MFNVFFVLGIVLAIVYVNNPEALGMITSNIGSGIANGLNWTAKTIAEVWNKYF